MNHFLDLALANGGILVGADKIPAFIKGSMQWSIDFGFRFMAILIALKLAASFFKD